MIQLSTCFDGFCFPSFLGGCDLKVVHFISKGHDFGLGSCTVYKGSCTVGVLEVVQFIRDVVQFPMDFIIIPGGCNTRHTNKKISVTTSLYHVQLSLINLYKCVQLSPSKLYKIDSRKVEMINFGI